MYNIFMIFLDDYFDSFDDDSRSKVFQVVPKVNIDSRGMFCQKLSMLDEPECTANGISWLPSFMWVAQLNESHSRPCTFRGFHAQRGPRCQGKLVESLHGLIFDVIVDARPISKTFGKSKAFTLDSVKKNMLWVPRGFLHGFLTNESDDGDKPTFAFQYFCDNTYDKESEIGICPFSIDPKQWEFSDVMRESDMYKYVLDSLRTDLEKRKEKFNLSEKDMNAMTFEQFAEQNKGEWWK